MAKWMAMETQTKVIVCQEDDSDSDFEIPSEQSV